MKKIFTLIATALMAVSVNAQQTEPVVYQFDNKAETYVLGDNTEPTTYKMDDNPDCFSVNYTSGSGEKMQIKLAANESIFFEYSNTQGTKNNVLKTGANYAVFDSKNFVINVPLQTDDVLYIKFSAKADGIEGGKENEKKFSKFSIYGEKPCITGIEEVVSKGKEDYQIIKVTATKGGTAELKETNNGCRLYAIAINSELEGATTGISEVAASKVAKARKVIVNGRLVIETANGTFSTTGARVK